MRKEHFITYVREEQLIRELCTAIKKKFPHLHPDNTLVLMVSPDYSATVAMQVAHDLSQNGEMCDIMAVHIPYPNEDVTPYKIKAEKDLDEYLAFTDKPYTSYLLVEAGVIKGGTYTWLTNMMKAKLTGEIITAALFENLHSSFKSDVVAEYYNDNLLDLTFYFERDNNHWK